jgi:SAM-dependent methyltransferase
MFEVIEHLSDPVGVLRQLRQLLRPGGWVAISTPNIHSLTHAMLGASWCVLNPSVHLHFFSEASLSRMLIAAGYDAVLFDRHGAGDDVGLTMFATHSFNPRSWRTRIYAWLVKRCGLWARGFVQSLGLADGLYCLARRPAAGSSLSPEERPSGVPRGDSTQRP